MCMRPFNLLILCRSLLLLPSIFPNIRVFSNESALHIRWPKYGSFSFNISPSSEHSGPTSPRMDWLDLLSVQGTLKSLLRHNSCTGILYKAIKTKQNKKKERGRTEKEIKLSFIDNLITTLLRRTIIRTLENIQQHGCWIQPKSHYQNQLYFFFL